MYRVYKESLLNPQRLMDDLGVDENLDSLGMGIIRKELDLTNDEKQYLLAVERGDVPSTRQFLGMAQQTGININCVDPLGRTALLIAIENENIEMIELLLSYGVELGDALLHAISEENVEAVELLLNHEVNSKGEEVSISFIYFSYVCERDSESERKSKREDFKEVVESLMANGVQDTIYDYAPVVCSFSLVCLCRYGCPY